MGGVTARHAKGRTYEAQYEWLQEKRDPNSSLESEFLSVLFASKHRLPDRAQYRPEEGVYCEADFFYEREGLKGIAVFIDGPHHDEPLRQQKDKEERHKLENCGYRVIVIRYNKTLPLQVLEHSDVFGPGMHRPVPVAAGS
jgi:very-short-patch-repair endonuclease